jgi:hypothetical protein
MIFWHDTDCCSPAAINDGNDVDATEVKKSTPTEAARVRHLLTSVQYSLLSTTYQHSSSEIHAEPYRIMEFCRITLILFSLTILNERPPSSSVGQQICGKFRGVLTDLAFRLHNGPITSAWILPLPREFCLWAIFLAASVIMNSQSSTKDWLLESLSELASPKNGAFEDWKNLKACLSRYMWVSSIHDCPLRRLWKEVEESRRKQVGT